MKKLFKTRARVEKFGDSGRYTVYYRKWYQRHWHQFYQGAYAFTAKYNYLAISMANQIERGEVKPQ